MRPCPHPGCPKLIKRGERACPQHEREAELRKPPRIRGRRLQQRNQRLARADPLCRRCKARGVTRIATEWDHEVPLEHGGADDESNLVGLCHGCHVEKTSEERRARQSGVGAV